MCKLFYLPLLATLFYCSMGYPAYKNIDSGNPVEVAKQRLEKSMEHQLLSLLMAARKYEHEEVHHEGILQALNSFFDYLALGYLGNETRNEEKEDFGEVEQQLKETFENHLLELLSEVEIYGHELSLPTLHEYLMKKLQPPVHSEEEVTEDHEYEFETVVETRNRKY